MNTTATASPDGDLMSRHQVAVMFRVTSARIAQWARRGRLREVRDEAGRPRYRRAQVEDLFLKQLQPGNALTGIPAGNIPAARAGGRPGRLCGGPDHPDWPLPPRR